MSTDYLKLTAYFAERLRGEHGLVAEELLDLFATHEVATSVVLRGIAGFGPRHHLRTDASLSAAEDLPVALAAVDTAERIAALAERTVAATDHGIVTLERARSPEDVTGDATGDAGAKLTAYVGRRTGDYRQVCEILRRHGFDATAVFLGVDGTDGGSRRRARFFSTNSDIPVLIIGIGSNDRVAAALPRLRELLPAATMTVERVEVCKRDGQLLARPPLLPGADDRGVPIWQQLTIHTSAAEQHRGIPIHRAVVARLRAQPGSGGVTALRGIWGYRGDQKPHGDTVFQLGRQVPVTTIVVDTPAHIAGYFDIIDELTAEHGLVTSELVPAVVSIDGGVRRGDTALARPPW